MPETLPLSPTPNAAAAEARAADAALARRRRGRNWAMLGVLLGLVVLFYAISIVKMAQHGALP